MFCGERKKSKCAGRLSSVQLTIDGYAGIISNAVEQTGGAKQVIDDAETGL